MSTPTSAALIAATQDPDLRARIIALGQSLGRSEQELNQSIPLLVGAACDEEGSTIAGVYEYAVATYDPPTPPPRPGENPAAVTDAHILKALERLNQ